VIWQIWPQAQAAETADASASAVPFTVTILAGLIREETLAAGRSRLCCLLFHGFHLEKSPEACQKREWQCSQQR
jgi:hypothetical protein